MKKINDKIDGFDIEAQTCNTACITFPADKPSVSVTGPGAITTCSCGPGGTANINLAF